MFDLIQWNFSNLSQCLRVWFCMFMSTCAIVYYCFHFWAYKRLSFIPVRSFDSTNTEKLKTNSTTLRKEHEFIPKENYASVSVIFDWIWFVAYCCYVGLFLYIPVQHILTENYPIVTRIIILAEQVARLKVRRFIFDVSCVYGLGSIPYENSCICTRKYATCNTLRSDLFGRK